MRLFSSVSMVLLMGILFLGCVSDDDFWALQNDVTKLENRLQNIEGRKLKQTQSEISNIEQSQKAQIVTLDQALAKVSSMERSLDDLARQQASMAARLERIEKAQIQDRQNLTTLEQEMRGTLNESLEKMRSSFNEAQRKLGASVDEKISRRLGNMESRISKLEKDINTFYRELEMTLQSYSSGTYVVKQGDTLSKIAQSLDISVDELARVNNIQDPSKIRVGQELILP